MDDDHAPMGTSPSVSSRSGTVALCGVHIDAVGLDDAVDTVLRWAGSGDDACRVVVTPNVNHAVLLYEQPALREVYRHADLVLADGAPLIALARLRGRPLPERVAGSDLVPRLLAGAPDGLRVYLLGAGPGVAETAAEEIHARWPQAKVVGCASPPLGFEHDPAVDGEVVDAVNQARPDLLVVGLGAPKQELWVHRHRHRLRAGVAVCAGATIDFLAGNRPRAPRWMQQTGLEWLYRISVEPKRLAGGCAHDGRVLSRLVWSELRGRPLVPYVPRSASAGRSPAHHNPGSPAAPPTRS
jgi:N-acetylglucosaminyldiphosphoundecaprenol N-acetyl-beta-D-mannosaminyltransferase